MKGESMSDPNNVPLPQQPEANGTPTPNPVPQYGAPAPAQPSQPAQPAYGQPAYGQPAPTANSYGQAVPTYGQPAPDANGSDYAALRCTQSAMRASDVAAALPDAFRYVSLR